MTQIIPLLDSHFAFDPQLFPAVRQAPDVTANLLGAASLPPQLDIPVWCYLVHTEDGPALIDTGSGGVFGDGHDRLQHQLADHGIAPDQIHRIWLTHLHGDHCGGLIGGQGEAAFLKARIALPAAEANHWLSPTLSGTAAEIGRDAQAALAPYGDRIDTISPGDTVDGATAINAHGHTPGHTAWLLPDGATLAAGDIVHVPALQLPNPDWSIDWDSDPAAAADTRKTLLARAKTDRLTLLTGHGGALDPTDLP